MTRDWTLYLKGEEDRFRFHQELRQYIVEQLPDLVGSLDGDEVQVTLPLEMDYRIRFKTIPIRLFEDAGSGGASFRSMDETGTGRSRLTYGNAITADAVASVFLQQLELPELTFQRTGPVPLPEESWSSISSTGILPLLDKHRTMRAALEQQMRTQSPELTVHPHDLRFHAPTDGAASTDALLLAVMDVSASMQEFERRMARTFFYWTQKFLRLRYHAVDVRFVVHHTHAFEVNSEEFFTVTDDGGTLFSAAYEKVQELLDRLGSPSNVYVLHVSDGDNRPGDQERAQELAQRIANRVNLLGYIEINRTDAPSPWQDHLADSGGRLRTISVRSTPELYSALRHMFSKHGWKAGHPHGSV